MTVIEKFFVLKATGPFAPLRDNELMLAASVAQLKTFGPGAEIHPGAAPLESLLVLVAGGWRSPDGPLPATLGVASLLFGRDEALPVLADAHGATCLAIGKREFHFIARECPELLLACLHEGAAQKTA